jgi:hypothetical protein
VLDFDPQVVGMASQPLEFDGADPDGAWRHVPDIFVRLADGSVRLVDVKNPAHHDRDDVQRQARRTQAACAELGWDYQFVGAIDPQRWRNISWLSVYRRPLHGGADLVPRVLALTTRPITLAELLSFLDEPAIVLPVIFHLCWRGQLVFDLDAPLRQNTVLRALIRKSSRGRGKPWSGGGLEGDLVAQCFELADVVTFLAFRADAVVVEVGA